MVQKHNAYAHANTDKKLQLMFVSNIRIEKVASLGHPCGTRWAGLSTVEPQHTNAIPYKFPP